MLKKTNIYIVLGCIFLLSACANKRPDIFTKQATHSVCKGKSCYKQNGKHYSLLKSSQHYAEKGTASWYGHQFNKKRTSSGERFNMYKMTAAHKTLPLATYVQVTNLSNGKKVVVKVNDRGPFVSNRLIDLSYAAAKRLGMVGRGLAHVEVKAIG